ncbi:hypothetical protein [Parvularcula dongshanensis]|uniref:Uncharacterized protein n=1 Tax=Parvularcula dongshanensis TaxID=1173995 RepID=A0A840I5A6_9PROT|nr:hypothetical protein [Parvularcula dongshanensis]MBB4659562.1 hypothetical protein [Parvularcula dongshanensis]
MKVLAIALLFGAMNPWAQVETGALDDSAFATGTLTVDTGALPETLWQGADAETVGALLDALPSGYAEPAYLDLARRVLLSPGEGPEGADDALAGRKLLAAARLGFTREAANLAELSPSLRGAPALSQVMAEAAMLSGDLTTACARGAALQRGRSDPFFLKLRFLCYVANGESAAADLTLGLLRDQGALTPGDERIFNTLQAGGSLGASVSPEDAVQYAAVRLLGAEVTPGAVPELPGGVLAAVARDGTAAAELRVAALERALALDLIDADEGRRLAQDLGVAEVGAALAAKAGTPEQAARLAAALEAAPDWTSFKARTRLLAEVLRTADPDAVAPDRRALPALAALVGGRREAASRWAVGMRTLGDRPETQDLTALSRAAANADLQLLPLSDRTAVAGVDAAGLVPLALAAARSRSPGAAALAALTGLGVTAEGEAKAVAEGVVAEMMSQSGEAPSTARRLAYDAGGARLFAEFRGQAPAAPETAEGEPVPSLKPTN